MPHRPRMTHRNSVTLACRALACVACGVPRVNEPWFDEQVLRHAAMQPVTCKSLGRFKPLKSAANCA